ncbi:MAG: hypothetical protein JRJ57_04605 [Deltaproteobacteria bacterium]|nr:hypothetical protein [Deltaproteobacteria bacterium]
MKTKSIPNDVKEEVKGVLEAFNRKTLQRDDCYYQARFKGKYSNSNFDPQD